MFKAVVIGLCLELSEWQNAGWGGWGGGGRRNIHIYRPNTTGYEGGLLVCWLVDWLIIIMDLGRGLSECHFNSCLLKLCVMRVSCSCLKEGVLGTVKCSDEDILWYDLHTIVQSPSIRHIGLCIILSTFMWQMCASRGACPGWWWREFWPGTFCSRLREQACQLQLSRQWEAGSRR
jgi:hypothetical protein